MNATVRPDVARTLVCSPRVARTPAKACPNALTLPTPRPVASADEGAEELIDRLVDSLLASFTFTEWERQVLHQALIGRHCGAIADRLGVRETTVHKHMHRIFAETRTVDRRGLYDLGLRITAQRAILRGVQMAA